MQDVKQFGEDWKKINLVGFLKGVAAEYAPNAVFTFFEIVDAQEGKTSVYGGGSRTKVLRLWFGRGVGRIDFSATYIPASHKLVEAQGKTWEELEEIGDLYVLESDDEEQDDKYIFAAKDKNIQTAREKLQTLLGNL